MITIKSEADGIPVFCSHDKIIDIIEAIPNPRNPNKHSDAQVDLLARIIKAQGWRNPIVISTLSGFITKGHCRLKAAQKLGVKQIPVDYQEYENPAAEWADIIADNKIAELSDPDDKMIRDILEEIKGEIDLDLTGYTGITMDKLLAKVKREDDHVLPGKSHDRPDMIEDEKKALEVPAEHAHLFEGKNNILVIFSGGIDSTFSLYWAKTNFPDRRIIGIFSDPGVELPGAALHAYQVCEHVGVEFQLVKPTGDMFIDIYKQASWPSIIYPWCQTKYVFKPINDWTIENLSGSDTIIIDGSGGEQQRRHTQKTKTSSPPKCHKRMQEYTYYHPRYDVSRETCELILKKAGIPIWWGYEMGAKRTACWMCPGMKGEQALFIAENFPGFAAYVRRIEEYLGKKLTFSNDQSFDDKVAVGKRQVARRAKNEALEEEEEYKIEADSQDS